jgi:D-aminopeptidase
MGEHTVNPVVGETNDGRVNNMWADPVGARGSLRRPGIRAGGGPVAEGSVGAGTGTQAFGWKGGIGSELAGACRRPSVAGRVGVLVQTNYGGVLEINGAPVGPRTRQLSLSATSSRAANVPTVPS